MTNLLQRITRKITEDKARIANIDAEINGGALVEVCQIDGKSLYIRVNQHDPDKAKHDVELVRSLLQSALIPKAEPKKMEWLTLKQAAAKSGLSIVTLRRYIKNGRLAKKKRGKEYIVSSKALEKL